jgi:hypothetical protein
MMVRTIPINNDPDFRALEMHAERTLSARGYKREPRKGSTSWIDPRIRPVDAAVRFKLCMYADGIFFGARQEWANSLGLALKTVGHTSRAPSPSPVEFRGDFVENNAAGRRRIDAIIALLDEAQSSDKPAAVNAGPLSVEGAAPSDAFAAFRRLIEDRPIEPGGPRPTREELYERR